MNRLFVTPPRASEWPWGDGQGGFGFSASGASGGEGWYDSLHTGDGESPVDYLIDSVTEPDDLSLPLLGSPP